MKKIISMLLVLTIVVTTLVGVMVVDVNAMKVTGGKGNDINTRTWNILMNKEYGQRAAMATGNWTVTPKQAADGVSVPYDLGRITQVPNLGKTYWHLEFKDIDYKDANNDNAATSVYARFRTDYTNPDLGVTNAEGADDLIPKIDIADFNNIVGGTTEGEVTTYGDMIRYTFYAYTNNKDTADFTILFSHPDSEIGSVNIPALSLYSENMIPHKVDVYVWSNSVDKIVGGSGKEGSKKEAVYFNVFVDGIQSVATNYAAETKANLFNATAFRAQFFLNFKPTTSTKNGGVYKFKGSDWYISHDGNKTHKRVTRANLDDDYFAEIKVKDTYTNNTMANGAVFDVTNKKDNIKGVKADVDAALEAAVVTQAGKDRKAVIYNEYYTNPASIFTGEETNVKLVDRKTGAEVAPAEATGTMDNYLFMVNDVYIVTEAIPDPPKYVTAQVQSFKAEGHNVIYYRAKHEDYVNNPYTDEKAFGGLRSGFYRFAIEPRSLVSFDKGSLQYVNNNGYVPMCLYSDKITLGSADAALSKYKVRKNIATTEFDIYLPEYTPARSENFRIAMGFYNNGWSDKNRYTDRVIYFTTGGIKGNMTTNDYLPYTVDVTPNTWNTISIQFDMEAAKVDGMIDCNVYVNGELSKSFDIGDAAKGVKFDDEAIKYYAPISHMRMYSPKYTQYGATPGAWYIGEYTPTATPVSTGILTSEDSKITVAEDDLLISSEYATEAETIAALPGYIPVYASSIDISTVNAKYDEVDGNIVKDEVEGGYKYTGIIIKRLCDLAGWFDITKDKETGKNIYTLPSNPTEGIVSAVDNGDNTATLTVTTKFTFSNTVEGAYHDVSSLIAEHPELKTDSLIGFALVEPGKLPKVYTLVPSGLEIRDLTFNKSTNKAELSYRKFGNVANAVSFQLVVAAYDKDGKLLELKSDVSKTINSLTTDGERTITFEPKFSEATLRETDHYKVFMFDSLVKCIPLFKSAKITK